MPEFYEDGTADEENFQESPSQEEASAAQDDEEYNSLTSKRKFSDFEEDGTYLSEIFSRGIIESSARADKNVRNVGKKAG